MKLATLRDIGRELATLERRCAAMRGLLADECYATSDPPAPYALLVDCPGCGVLHAGGHADTCACDHCAALVPRGHEFNVPTTAEACR